MTGVLHLIECHCSLSRVGDLSLHQTHKFVVFSVIDDGGVVIPKLASCNNCGTIHNVVDVCRSEIFVGDDNEMKITGIKDIKPFLPQSIREVLESYDCDLPLWEKAHFILTKQMFRDEGFDSKIILKRVIDAKRHLASGKILVFSRDGTPRIESFEEEMSVTTD